MAIGIHEALRLYGLSYVVDPKTPFTEYSKNKLSVDFLQFSRQTLNYTAGDYDDLSILYSALLESVGIETSFITIPGHIFMAFSHDEAACHAVAVYDGTIPQPTDEAVVKSLGISSANPLGLYDMSGNVWEWCFTESGSNRVNWGGSWNHNAEYLLVGAVYSNYPNNGVYSLGFRLCRTR